MKNQFTLLAVTALFISACGPAAHVSEGYVDDTYYTPGDTPPPSIEKVVPVKQQPARKQIVMSNIRQNTDSSQTLENTILSDNNSQADVKDYNIENAHLSDSDTTQLYNDNQITSVINNYYTPDNDIDYAGRINHFYNGSYYDPFWYNDYAWGFYGPRFSWSFGWYDPWFYDYAWYGNPYWYGGFGWGYGWGVYYPGWYGGYYTQPYFANYGKRRTENVMAYGSGIGRRSIYGMGSYSNGLNGSGSAVVARQRTTTSSVSALAPSPQNNIQNLRTRNGNTTVQVSPTGQGVTNGGTAIERRRANYDAYRNSQDISETNVARQQMRSYNPGRVRQIDASTYSSRSNGYTPSYNTPRSNYRASYNRNAYSQYSRPRVIQGSSSSSSRAYSAPNGIRFYRGSSTQQSRYIGTTSSRTASFAPSRSGSYSAPSSGRSSGGGSNYGRRR